MTTVLVWNIEMYGAKFTSNSPVDTLCRMIRDQMIAAIIQASGAQVVVVQELRKNGIDRLPVVAELLNALDQTGAWAFDLVEGAVFDEKAKYPDFSDVFFSQSANNEGYAVFWRTASATLGPITYVDGKNTKSYNQSYGQNSTHYNKNANHVIALVNEGYTFTWVPDGNQLGIQFKGTSKAPGKGFIGFPYSNIPNIVGDEEKDGKILSRANTRRPAVIAISNNGSTVPVVAYHAPVHLNSSIAGTLAALVAKDLCSRTVTGAYQVQPTRVFAGDLNLKTGFNNLSANAAAANAGLTKTMIQNDGDSPATMVRPMDYFNATYNDASYLYTCRDYAFGSGPVNSVGIYDPVSALCANQTLARIFNSNEGIMELLFHEQSYIAQLPLPYQPLQGGDWADVLSKYLGVLQGTVSADDQQNICSVFYRYFVSDHIPVQITLN